MGHYHHSLVLGEPRHGVVEAVNEFCNKHDWRLAYLTNEARRYLSIAITHTKER